MKKILLMVLPIALVFASCKKYEDGPMVSLNTKKHRAVNTWVIEKVFEAGVDKTADYKAFYVNYLLDIKKDNSYTLSYSPWNLGVYNESGDWDFNNDKTHLIFRNSASSSSSIGSDWVIFRLKEKELWGKTTNNNGTVIEAHFIPN